MSQRAGSSLHGKALVVCSVLLGGVMWVAGVGLVVLEHKNFGSGGPPLWAIGPWVAMAVLAVVFILTSCVWVFSVTRDLRRAFPTYPPSPFLGAVATLIPGLNLLMGWRNLSWLRQVVTPEAAEAAQRALHWMWALIAGVVAWVILMAEVPSTLQVNVGMMVVATGAFVPVIGIVRSLATVLQVAGRGVMVRSSGDALRSAVASREAWHDDRHVSEGASARSRQSARKRSVATWAGVLVVVAILAVTVQPGPIQMAATTDHITVRDAPHMNSKPRRQALRMGTVLELRYPRWWESVVQPAGPDDTCIPYEPEEIEMREDLKGKCRPVEHVPKLAQPERWWRWESAGQPTVYVQGTRGLLALPLDTYPGTVNANGSEVLAHPQEGAAVLGTKQLGDAVEQVRVFPNGPEGFTLVSSEGTVLGFMRDEDLRHLRATVEQKLVPAMEALKEGEWARATLLAEKAFAFDRASQRARGLLVALYEAQGDARAEELRKELLPLPAPHVKAPTPVHMGKRAYVAASAVKLRKGPDGSAPVLATLPINASLEVQEVKQEWVRVLWHGVANEAKRVDLGASTSEIPGLQGWVGKELVGSTPQDIHALSRQASAHQKANEPHEATVLLERALALAPDSVPVVVKLRDTALLAGRFASALLAVKTFRQVEASNARMAVETLDVISGCKGDWRSAEVVDEVGAGAPNACLAGEEVPGPCADDPGRAAKRTSLDAQFPRPHRVRMRVKSTFGSAAWKREPLYLYALTLHADTCRPEGFEKVHIRELPIPDLAVGADSEFWLEVPEYTRTFFGLAFAASEKDLRRSLRVEHGSPHADVTRLREAKLPDTGCPRDCPGD